MTKLKRAKGFWLSILLSLIFFAVIQVLISGGIIKSFLSKYVNVYRH